jgi:pimeloyl-ACP methyl ester carboxylesterase
MRIEVNGTELWFDVVGASREVAGSRLRRRPTLLALHGGPAGYDHSYLRPHLDRLAAFGQVVYLDLTGHGRSDHLSADEWSLERCADDLQAFCDRLGIAAPVLFGHSMGGFVALLHALRHPGQASGLLLQATAARHDPSRIVAGFRARFGADLAAVAGRVFRGDTTSAEERRQVLDAFGPNRPDDDAYARIVVNPELEAAMPQLTRFDVVDQLHRIEVPVLVTVGELDPVTPVAAAQEIAAGMAGSSCHLEVLDGVGHFPWLDAPHRYWPHIEQFIASRSRPTPVSSAGRSGAGGSGCPDPSGA